MDLDAAPPFPVRSIEKVEMVVTRALWGKGIEGSTLREVTQYWTLDGECVFTLDLCGECKPKGENDGD